jgi:hypothetical protein
MKAKWQMSAIKIPFSTMMTQLKPFFIIFFISGTVMMTGFFFVLYPLLKNQVICNLEKSFKKRKSRIKQVEEIYAID